MGGEEVPREMMVIVPDCTLLHRQEHMTLKHGCQVPGITNKKLFSKDNEIFTVMVNK